MALDKGSRVRRGWLGNIRLFFFGGVICGGFVQGLGAAEPGQSGFSFAVVQQRARDLAAHEYKPITTPELPDFLRKLDYDGYQDIRFRPDHNFWAGQQTRFGLQFFHRGYLYQDPVRLHLIEEGQVQDVQFNPAWYDYGKNSFPGPVPANLDFAGFRVLYPLAPPKLDEVTSFLGASYFRLVGAQQRYGAACRMLAIDTAEPSGEEFPRFTEFWIEKPSALADSLQCFALLDSPSVAGAYRFVLHVGENTRADVETSLFFRKEVHKIGLAPLNSMFLVGENRTQCIPDFRPEVHDSDGLLLQTGGKEWIWRPLDNPQRTHRVNRFPLETINGFGLLQRDRDFRSYEDLAARYELRASLWVETDHKWGAGAVELVEIPTASEWNDNIVAYWVPKEKPALKQEFHLVYSLSALRQEPAQTRLLHLDATRIDPAREKKPVRFILDFAGEPFPALDPKTPVTANIQASRGEVRNLVTEKNEVTGGWRVFFDLIGQGAEPVELRGGLRSGPRPISETWVYHFQS